MDVGINDNIAGVLAAIIGLGLALRAGVGPVVMYLTEAIKDAVEPPPGYGGLISVIVGILLGTSVGALTAILTAGTDVWTYAAFGALGGLFMASGAIEAHKAAGAVNTQASAAIETGNRVALAQTVRTLNPWDFPGVQPSAAAMATPAFGRDSSYDSDRAKPAGDMSSDDDTREAEFEEWDWASARQDSGHGQNLLEEVPPLRTEQPSTEYRGLGHPSELI